MPCFADRRSPEVAAIGGLGTRANHEAHVTDGAEGELPTIVDALDVSELAQLDR